MVSRGPRGMLVFSGTDLGRGFRRMSRKPEWPQRILDIQATHSPEECWPWTGRLCRDGYARAGGGKPAARLAYEMLVGPIAPGLEPDHLCRNRACVNPAHLEPVTHRVNSLRSVGFVAINAAKTHCNSGHEFTFENTYRNRDGNRQCRACHNASGRARYARRKLEGSHA